MAKQRKQPGDAELTVLKVLWSKGPLSAREIGRQLESLGTTWANTTIHTLLTRLKQKLLVDSEKSDGVNVFRAKIQKQDLAESSVDHLVEKLGKGTAFPVVKALIDQQRLTETELIELRELVNKLTPAKTKKREKRK